MYQHVASSGITTVSFSSASDFATAIATNPDVEAEVLSDGSHAFMDFPFLFGSGNSNNNGGSKKLRMRYAQVLGRLMVIAVGFLPQHGFHHPEELVIQLLLLGLNLKPIVRSMRLYNCIKNTGGGCCCEEECCRLELEELDQSLRFNEFPSSLSSSSEEEQDRRR